MINTQWRCGLSPALLQRLVIFAYTEYYICVKSGGSWVELWIWNWKMRIPRDWSVLSVYRCCLCREDSPVSVTACSHQHDHQQQQQQQAPGCQCRHHYVIIIVISDVTDTRHLGDRIHLIPASPQLSIIDSTASSYTVSLTHAYIIFIFTSCLDI